VAGFVQIIEYQTSRIDEVVAIGSEFRERMMAEAQSGPRPLGGTVTADRDRPGTYLSIIVFESHEAAMQNSNRPEVQDFANRMAQLTDGPPRFYNLDVVDDWRFDS
jgi:hypothetical protein